MRAVSRAICTSGEPVSPAARWCCWTICAFCETLAGMLSHLFAKGGHFTLKSAPSTSAFGRPSAPREQPLRLQRPARIDFPGAEEHSVLAEDCYAAARGTDRDRLAVPELRRDFRLQRQPRARSEQRFRRQEPFAPLAERKRLERIQGDRLAQPERADRGALQRRKMRAATERRTDVLGERPDVGAFAALDEQYDRISLELLELERSDRDSPRGSRNMLAAAGVRIKGDRKSTRLNSSHDQISYAVF